MYVVKVSDSMAVHNRIEKAVALAEELIGAGRTDLVPVIRQLSDLDMCVREFSDGTVVAGLALRAIETLLDAIDCGPEAPASMPPDEFTRRARLLAADVMQIGFDEQGHFEFHDIMACQVAARRVLTGVDEGSYTGREDERREAEEQRHAAEQRRRESEVRLREDDQRTS
jgi:hypothetical protein